MHNIQRGVRQRCIYSTDLLNVYSEPILKDLDVLPRYITGGQNIADDTLLIQKENYKGSYRRLWKKEGRKETNINQWKTECNMMKPKCKYKFVFLFWLLKRMPVFVSVLHLYLIYGAHSTRAPIVIGQADIHWTYCSIWLAIRCNIHGRSIDINLLLLKLVY